MRQDTPKVTFGDRGIELTERLVRQKNESATAIRDWGWSASSSSFSNLFHFLTFHCISAARDRVGEGSTCRRFATLCDGVCEFPRTHVRGYNLSSRCDW